MSELESLKAEANKLAERIAELEAEAKKPKFPIATKFYAHSDKESGYSQAEELGLEGEAARTFSRTGYEVTFDILVQEDGTAMATHVNGTALTAPVEI